MQFANGHGSNIGVVLHDQVFPCTPTPRYAVQKMANRDDLKVLIDQLPDERLDIVRRMLDYHVNPHPQSPKSNACNNVAWPISNR